MQKLQFAKMQGAGNDFIVLDGIRQPLTLTPAQIRWLADRHFGIGADQILLVEHPSRADADFKYRIFNADGGEVEHCGNGARCFVKFVHAVGLTHKRQINVEVQKGLIRLTLQENGEVCVEMGAPLFDPACVPFDTAQIDSHTEGNDTLWPLELGGKRVWVSVLSMGNPHAVQQVDEIEMAPVSHDGALIEAHSRFAQRVNAGFMQIVRRDMIKLRVYERGAGETLACGTGACAAAVTAIRRGLVDSPVTVSMRGGQVTILWEGAEIYMVGSAMTVFNGEIDMLDAPASSNLPV
ncbi:diaminopimelate epimerase [Mycoavidus sp. B2-EB]|uniref:diaminopimelate epimerase n=1 Tax=Mycoavidus sp. B2-EB TaxID=2651972 RepID=UPI0016259627|nr:diaminopimelate epimerase [Mycoavidus sp. B2-EB]BBO58968.1 diaminopimelate epimerase [Mycoavidus sp. B2-EB]